MSRPRFLLDEHVWSGLVEVGKRLGADVVLAQTQLPPPSHITFTAF